MQIHQHDIGLCSWSLGTTTAGEIIDALKAVGLSHVQLGLSPYVEDETTATRDAAAFKAAGITIASGMIGFAGEDYATIDRIRETGGFLPDDLADERIARAIGAAKIGKSAFGITRVSMHAGFLPTGDSPQYAVVMKRLRTVADAFAAEGVELLFETGQETADHLAHFLTDLNRPNVKANFDPANMILYGAGDPISAVRTLGRFIGQVHVKDATPSDRPGETWGEEVPVGSGAVDWTKFLDALKAIDYRGPLVIEREAGATRIADMKAAVDVLQRA
ncbi:MAG TPA: sugar phosphate isomerase/epimerase family protein [Tepidisphaeraceae bacterium]|jgi:sugar phosphate isomerase/epimerase|nr:sugar phosphate isomerase/epimerase family protein [Tepidisphaeraceae bacterium]